MAVLAFISVLVGTVVLGLFPDNYFLAYGMLLVGISSAITIYLAARNAIKARSAKDAKFEEYLPQWNDAPSYTFRYTASLMGVNTRDPLAQVTKDIEELRKVVDGDKERFEMLYKINRARVDSCLAQIQYHDEVTLPRVIAQGAGYSVMSAVLAIWGSLYLAFPVETYQRAKDISAAIKLFWG
ncbi:hypothetical protein [Pseudomonas oryzihabitans]|uniref:hypothetical protein n=1 Tax=Pseudomonas oryzihabitans TaxID=47885 RepID=UPI0028A8DCA0|nr:hypothetical protein [Pseudomonas oryzihabitans]